MANSQLTRNRALLSGGFAPIVRRIRVRIPDGSEQASGLTLPARAVVLGAWVDVRVEESTGGTPTLDVGTPTDPNGFLAAVDVSSPGVVKGTLDSGGQTLGALLSADEDGGGTLVPESDVSSGGENVVYTAGSNDFAELEADIYVMYLNLSDK